MSDAEAIVTLPEAAPARLAEAVQSAVMASSEVAERLRQGAAQSVTESPGNLDVARWFQTLLEVGYLVASADGFADEERASLARLLEAVTGSAIDHDVLELHFKDLDEQVAALGRRERLARTAADLTEPSVAEEAVGLTATIAMADGCLSAPEYAVLVELGEHLGIGGDRVRSLVDAAADLVKGGLG